MNDDFSDFVTAVASRTHKGNLYARVAITVPVLETSEEQHRFFKLVREWILSDEFWADAKRHTDSTANSVRRGSNAITFMPEKLDAEWH